MKKSVFYDKLFSFISFIFLTVITIFALFVFDEESFKTQIIRYIFIIFNGISALLSFITIFKSQKYIYGAIYFIEGIIVLFCGHPLLALFFYFVGLILFFTTNCPFIRTILFNTISVILWLSCLIINTFSNLKEMLFSIVSSLFVFSLYFYSYQKLERFFIPKLTELREMKKLPLPIVNSHVHINSFDLKEKQKYLLYDYTKNGMLYKDLADKYNMSVSAVKTEMSNIFDYFNCESSDELKKIFAHFDVLW